MTSGTKVGGQKDEILLEAGTNELEVLVFTLDGSPYGVNVAKVREVIRGVTPTTTPGMHQSLLGMINMRGSLIPIVDLGMHLELCDQDARELDDQRIIITEFNGRLAGFMVEDVEQIYRVSWKAIAPAPEMHGLSGDDSDLTVSTCTGVLEHTDRLIMMIDFESIADSISLDEKLHITSVENPDGVDRESYRVLLVDDSAFVRSALTRVFRGSGYTGIEVHADGAAAWKAIEASLGEGERGFDCIVSDIEMPMMDGLALTKRIRETAGLADVPVILFSSLIYKENMNKGEQVGATMQIAKPELQEAVRIVDRAVTGKLEAVKSAA